LSFYFLCFPISPPPRGPRRFSHRPDPWPSLTRLCTPLIFLPSASFFQSPLYENGTVPLHFPARHRSFKNLPSQCRVSFRFRSPFLCPDWGFPRLFQRKSFFLVVPLRLESFPHLVQQFVLTSTFKKVTPPFLSSDLLQHRSTRCDRLTAPRIC